VQPPKSLVGAKIWKRASCVPMGNPPDSDQAVAARLQLLRQVVSGESQTAFAARLGIETKRWNNFERGSPLSKEVAFAIVRKFPNVTLDWLWLGRPDGMPVRFQRELEEAGNATTPAQRSRTTTG
jgi:hypothetical protein